MPSSPVTTLAVERLQLSQFRSYREAVIEPAGRHVVLTGPNGAGKTNLLEAVSLLAPGRGLRRARNADLIRRLDGREAAPGWAVNATLTTPDGVVSLGTGLEPGAEAGAGRRVTRLSGRAVSSQTEWGRHVAAVWLTPQMDRLFTDAAAPRRRFLDRLVLALEPGHGPAVSAYEVAMRERNRLLKEGRRDRDWLDALEARMAASGAALAAARRRIVERLAGQLAEAPVAGFPPARLHLAGEVEERAANLTPADCEGWLRELWRQERASDGGAGMTRSGPHRCDLQVSHGATSLPAGQCSTGEQKALLIGIVLAHVRLISALRPAPPLLLLDEVAAHLDSLRRQALYDGIMSLGAQAWLTGTDAGLFASMRARAEHYRVEGSTVMSAVAGPAGF